jgi:hypothetical protein
MGQRREDMVALSSLQLPTIHLIEREDKMMNFLLYQLRPSSILYANKTI